MAMDDFDAPVEIVELDVSLSFSTLIEPSKGVVVLASSFRKRRKKGKYAVHPPKSSKTKKPVKQVAQAKTAAQKKKKRRGKKTRVTDLEVTSNTEAVLEDPSSLDLQYQTLKRKVLAQLDPNIELIRCSQTSTLESEIENILDNSNTNTFYLVDLTTVILKYKNWNTYLPRIRPFYAIKCNPDQHIVKTLLACGTGLDVASMPELQKGLAAGASPDFMIFANPCKMAEHIMFAKQVGVKKMTFDNFDELRKIHAFFPEAHLVLRILADDSHSTMRFGSKFGASVDNEAEALLKAAYELGLTVIGVSFHVGSGCQSGEAYRNSIRSAHQVFTIAERLGHPMNFLDIGGGFLGTDTETVVFKDIATVISATLTELFPDPNITIIAEPGRYFASECVVLVTTVIARRERTLPRESDGETPETYVDYYISDGIYGSFNNMFFDYASPSPVPLNKKLENSSPTEQHHRSTLFGPTCDSLDLICKDVDMPDLTIGDRIYFFHMGAYTSAAASSFNGFVPPSPHYMIS